MILKSIFIDLNRDEFSSDEAYSYKKKSRHLLNFVERECLKKVKHKTENFDRIVIMICQSDELKKPYINSENVLIKQINIDQADYRQLKTEVFSEYFIEVLVNSLSKLNEVYELPLEKIKDCVNCFRSLNYSNIWLHKKKLNRERKITAFLDCQLKIDEFSLKLRVQDSNKNTVFQKELLKLEPDETVFYYRFKDISYENDKLVITSRTSTNLFEVPLDKLLS
jgi:hypothetical protein